jgi:hypothetical protein
MLEWRENQVEAPANQPEHWVMYFDGSLKFGGGGAGVLLISPKGEQLKYVFQILFEDSSKVNKEWDVNKNTMDAYVVEILKLENKFLGLKIYHVIRDNNMGADVLSKLDFDRANVPSGVFIHELYHPSIKTPDPSTIAQGPTEPDREVLMIEVD